MSAEKDGRKRSPFLGPLVKQRGSVAGVGRLGSASWGSSTSK